MGLLGIARADTPFIRFVSIYQIHISIGFCSLQSRRSSTFTIFGVAIAQVCAFISSPHDVQLAQKLLGEPVPTFRAELVSPLMGWNKLSVLFERFFMITTPATTAHAPTIITQ